MEAVGLGVGIVSLASLFHTVLKFFEGINMAKSFAPSLLLHTLRLENLRLRLSRWGDAIGLSGTSVTDATALPSNIWSEEDTKKAEKTLGLILEQFQKAQEISEPYNAEILTLEESTYDTATLSLCKKMRDMCMKRQNNAKLAKKIRFVIWDKKQLDELVEGIATLTDQLVNLFPSQKAKQAELATNEVFQLIQPFRALNEAAIGLDEDLRSALKPLLEPMVCSTSILIEEKLIPVEQYHDIQHGQKHCSGNGVRYWWNIPHGCATKLHVRGLTPWKITGL